LKLSEVQRAANDHCDVSETRRNSGFQRTVEASGCIGRERCFVGSDGRIEDNMHCESASPRRKNEQKTSPSRIQPEKRCFFVEETVSVLNTSDENLLMFNFLNHPDLCCIMFNYHNTGVVGGVGVAVGVAKKKGRGSSLYTQIVRLCGRGRVSPWLL
jgi:hypothetical protein